MRTLLLEQFKFGIIIMHLCNISAHYVPASNRRIIRPYDTLKEHRHDKLMKLKFQAFKDVAHKMNLFLTVFQTDAPMIPFLSDTLKSLMRRIMGYVVRGTVLD